MIVWITPRIDVKATCPDSHSLTFEFDSFDGGNKPVAFEYSQPNDNGERYLDVIYRLDAGHQLMYAGALSAAQYINRGQMVFTAVGTDYEPADIDKANAAAGSDDSSGNGGFGGTLMKALTGGFMLATLAAEAMQPQDIGALLRAQRVRIQLPISGGQKEVVEFAPGEASFQGFLSRCHVEAQASVPQLTPQAEQTQPSSPPPDQGNSQPQPQSPDQNQQTEAQRLEDSARSIEEYMVSHDWRAGGDGKVYWSVFAYDARAHQLTCQVGSTWMMYDRNGDLHDERGYRFGYADQRWHFDRPDGPSAMKDYILSNGQWAAAGSYTPPDNTVIYNAGYGFYVSGTYSIVPPLIPTADSYQKLPPPPDGG